MRDLGTYFGLRGKDIALSCQTGNPLSRTGPHVTPTYLYGLIASYLDGLLGYLGLWKKIERIRESFQNEMAF